MKINPHNHQEKYLKWKEKVKDGIPFLTKENSSLILQYLSDMEREINISLRKVSEDY
jgi:hypothetical protein